MTSGGRETHLHVNEICGGKQISNVSSPDGCFSSPPMEKRVNDDTGVVAQWSYTSVIIHRAQT